MNLYVAIGIIAGVLLLLIICKVWANGPSCKFKPSLFDKVVVITGANTGIGYQTALQLAKLNPKAIVLACRSTTKGQNAVDQIQKELKVDCVEFMKLDLGDFKSIRDFADQVKEKFERIDILINNAGVFVHPNREETEQGYEKSFGVNHLGPFLLTQLLLDKVRASEKGRIVNVASGAHVTVKPPGQINFEDLQHEKTKYASFPVYAHSKLCNLYFTRQLDLELKKMNIQNVKTCSLCPGLVRTDLGRDYFDGQPVKYCIFKCCCGWLFWLLTKSPWYGCQTTLHCSLMDWEDIQSGSYYKDCKVETKKLKLVQDWKEDAKKLWDISQGFVDQQ